MNTQNKYKKRYRTRKYYPSKATNIGFKNNIR